MKYSISLNFKYLSMKMNWEKSIFLWNFEPLGILCIPQYLTLSNALLARLYLKVKVYITILLSVYNLQKNSYLK